MLSVRHLGAGRAFAHIAKFHPELTAFRRDLHAHPELGFEEVYTSSRVVEALRLCGVDAVHTGIGKTGVVAIIHGKTNASQKMIALRADMDALPLQEHNDVAWKSGKQGLVNEKGQVMADFERFPAQAAFAMHNSPETEAGVIGITPGPMQAAVDRIEIIVTGKGGHGARPQNCIDPILVAAHIITAAQSIVSRNVAAVDQVVLSICSVQAGNPGAMSVMPGAVNLVGTVRTYRTEIQDEVEQRLRALCESIAAGFGAQATLIYERVYPATVNTLPEAQFASDVAASLVGESRVIRNMAPSMGGEDFSFMLQVVPGAYMRLGQGSTNGCFLHNSRYDFNDEVLPLGSAMHASLIEQAMPLAV